MADETAASESDHTSTARKVSAWLWDNKAWIWARVKELRQWFTGSKKDGAKAPGILILGPGGVGKTTLARLLSGEFDLLFDAMERYDESIGIERYTLSDAPNVEVVVPPGQKHRREATWSDLHADIAAGKYRGIIVVTAYGFHSLGEQAVRDFGRTKQKRNAFVKQLLAKNRQDEVSVMQQLQPHLQASRGKLWIVSVVAKQDLWWHEHGEVEKHYRKGEYGVSIRRALRSRPSTLRHEFVFASLLIANFATQTKEVLKPNAEGYDQHRQIQSLRRLFETLDALRTWESG